MAGTSFAGHNGLQSISQHLGGMKGFTRLGIGIGRPESHESGDVAKYVLSKFTPDELDTITKKLFPDLF